MKENRKKGRQIAGTVAMTVAGVLCIAASEPVYHGISGMMPAPAGTIVYKQVQAPVAAHENGVITAEEWADIYPEIVASYHANDDNSYRIDYLEQDPYIQELYEGFGFAKDYTSAISHTYTLEDVAKTERPHPLANCLTCKTPDYTKLVNDMGVDAYKLDFETTLAQMNENISCYNCHENQAGNGGELVVTHAYVPQALGADMDGIDAGVLVCGQCHIEYYFDPDTKATSMPYSNTEEMTPDAILAYYNAMDYADWTQESTGARMLKAQHPEMETYLSSGSAHASMLSCADCHMAVTTEGRVTYTSHKWESPLNNPTLLNTCVECHGDTDMTAKVHAIQTEITGREQEVGERVLTLKNMLVDAVASGAYTEEELDEIRDCYRSAQWYWDFCYVENSEGAHNSSLARHCLDQAEALAEEGLALFRN